MDEESQAHLVNCVVILNDNHIKSLLEGFTYQSLFSNNLKIQIHMVKIFQLILNLRTKILKKEDSSSQAPPVISGASYTTTV